MSAPATSEAEYDAVEVNRIFHDHECRYYDERFAITHDERSAQRARREIEAAIGRRLRDGEVVVDIGCGTGWYAAGLRRALADDLPSTSVIGVDLSAGMLDRARAAGGWPLVQADGGRLPLPDASVDVIATRGVLHHLPEIDSSLAEWRRVLRPGGALVLSSEPTPVVETHGEVLVRGLLALFRTPLTPEEDFWEVASMAANLHVFTTDDIAAAATRAGFGIVDLDTAGFAATLLLTASYVVHGRSPRVGRVVPWRWLEDAGRTVDGLVLDRVLPARWRHTVVGVLRP